MLLSLNIKNLALIEDSEIELNNGLNIIVGESGSGKSLIMNAIKFIAGSKADKELIRYGRDFALVEAVFEFDNKEFLDLSNLYIDESNLLSDLLTFDENLSENDIRLLIISREIRKNGRSICRLNGRMVPLNLVSKISSFLMELHSQNEVSKLFDEKNHIKIIDDYADEKISVLKEALTSNLKDLKNVYKRSKEIIIDPNKRDLIIKKLSKQLAIFDSLKLTADEEELLIKRREELLKEKLKLEKLMYISTCISGSEDNDYSLYNYLSKLGRAFSDLYSLDDKLVEDDALEFEMNRYDEEMTSLERMFDCLNEIERKVNLHISLANFNEDELYEIEKRLKAISTLKGKLNLDYVALLQYERSIREKLKVLDDSIPEIKDLNQRKITLENKVFELKNDLHKAREKAAEDFCRKMETELVDLGMSNCKFTFDLSAQSLDENSSDKLIFLFSANLGEEVKSLAKVASGGEATRILLSMKLLLAGKRNNGLLLFDEIEQGVSGDITVKLAQKLAKLAKAYQVICISHQVQMATYADNIYKVEKLIKNNRTVSRIKLLNCEESVNELVALLGKLDDGEEAEQLIRNMLKKARAFKEKL